MLMWSLFIGHLIGDWLLQRGEWAKRKVEEKKYLIIHSLVYSLSITIMYLTHTQFFPAVVWVFIISYLSHYIIDDRKLTIWWVENIKLDDEKPNWLVFVIDQCFHIIILYLIARFMGG